MKITMDDRSNSGCVSVAINENSSTARTSGQQGKHIQNGRSVSGRKAPFDTVRVGQVPLEMLKRSIFLPLKEATEFVH